MHIPGHLALALAQHRLPPLSANKNALAPLLLSSIFPDLVDKTLGYVLHVMPNGRHYAHNIFSLVGISLLVSLIWGKATGLAWFLGYLGHLLADQHSAVPWLFPARKYHFSHSKFHFSMGLFLKEAVFLLLALIIYKFGR